MCEMIIIGKKDCNNCYNEYIYGVCFLYVVFIIMIMILSEDMLFLLCERKVKIYYSLIIVFRYEF